MSSATEALPLPAGVSDVADESLRRRIQAGSKDSQALLSLLQQANKELYTEFLRIVEEILKHQPGDTGDKERLFQAYRARVLNAGNQTSRLFPTILRNFLVEQIFTTNITVTHAPRADGPHGLPLGVKLPSSRA